MAMGKWESGGGGYKVMPSLYTEGRLNDIPAGLPQALYSRKVVETLVEGQYAVYSNPLHHSYV